MSRIGSCRHILLALVASIVVVSCVQPDQPAGMVNSPSAFAPTVPGLQSLFLLSDAETRSISPENLRGQKAMGGRTELEDGSAYLYVNNCSFSRSCLQMGLKGEYEFLNGVVGGSTCDGARRLFDLWRNYIGTPFHHVLTIPRKTTPEAHALYYQQVVTFKEHLEDSLGIRITEERLRHSIDIYNESRTLLQQLYDLRKLDNFNEHLCNIVCYQ